MRNTIKQTIKALKTMRRQLDSLIEFKAILDFKQAEMFQMVEYMQSRDENAALRP
jgi:hypothetical protein